MNIKDNEFFEEYKKLDKICSEIFGCYNGISEYISQMEHSINGQYKVSSWNKDYKTLKHLRWVRNQIAHDVTNDSISDENDLIAVKNFYIQIITQNDPLAKLQKAENYPDIPEKIKNNHVSSWKLMDDIDNPDITNKINNNQASPLEWLDKIERPDIPDENQKSNVFDFDTLKIITLIIVIVFFCIIINKFI